MKYATAGRRRTVTDEQVRRIREWKPLAQLAKELGMTRRAVDWVREGYQFKQKSP